MFKNVKIGTKILVAFTLVAITAVGLVGFFAFTSGSTMLEEESFNKLTAVREMKASQIEDYFQLVENQVITLSKDRMIIDAMRSFDDGLHDVEDELGITDAEMEVLDAALELYYEDEFIPRLVPNLLKDAEVDEYWPQDEKSRVLQYLYLANNPNDTGYKDLLDNAEDGSTYSQVHARYHPILRDFLQKFGYYDVFLIDADTGGHIAYSVFKEVDYGTSLLSGPYSDTNFAEAFRAARDATDEDFVKIVDFEPYDPSYYAPAAFIASPIFDGDEKIGVLVFQFPIDRINAVMTSNQDWSAVGLGDSGETYIVGDDFLLRNQSRFLIEDSENYFQLIEEIGTPLVTRARIKNINSTIGLQEVKTDGTEAALNGEIGTDIFPAYRGVSVLSSYKPLSISDLNWVIMSEIDEEEAFAAIRELGTRTLRGVIGLIAAIVLMAVYFSRTITRPLNELTETADVLASGDLDVEIGRKDQGDEIGDLARSFDVMRLSMKDLIGELEEINQNLEQKVEERTAELVQSRKEAEEAKARLEAASEASQVGIWDHNLETDSSYFSPSYMHMLGYKTGEFPHSIDTFTKLVHPGDKIKNDEITSVYLESGKWDHYFESEFRLLSKDGGWVWLLSRGKVTEVDADGKPVLLIGANIDITDIKKAREELHASEAKHRTIFQNSPLGMILFNNEGVIIDCNERFVELMGSSREQLIGFNTLRDASDPLVRERLGKALNGEWADFEGPYTSATGGKSIDLRIIYNPVDPDKRPTEVIATLEDITERKYIEEQLRKQKERMEIELNFAREIQMSMIPLIFPAFPTRKELSVYATLKPAREVGGDFYDFYFIDDDHLCFVIGDVSGKGAPGALLMAVAKTLIKSRAMDDTQPASILTHVNDELSRDNKSSMFVTVFLGIINVKTGEVTYTNAGHNPPYLKRSDGSIGKIDAFHGPVIGAMPGLSYKQDELELDKNDIILMYTDGVTETFNEADQLFGENRLVNILEENGVGTSEELINATLAKVISFQGETEQADDITILAVQYTAMFGKSEMKQVTVTINNRLEDLGIVEEQFHDFAVENDVPDTVRQKVSVVLDEMLNNLVTYAYVDDEEHEIDIEIELSGKRLVVTIMDEGVPFNPFGVETPDISTSVDERELGGLGIHLVRSVMDEYQYQRQINKNVVTLVKLIEE